MSTFVFGANGMLGSSLMKYLKGVIGITKRSVDASVRDWKTMKGQLDTLLLDSSDVVINAMGITNKRNSPDIDFIMVNTIFPRLLADYCEHRGVNMIHITTDCVYDGLRGNYNEGDVANAKDIYGLTKLLGEPINCTVIRTSTIGESNRSDKDLLEWVRSNRGLEIKGYTDHHWNGITCLQYAKVCEKIIREELYWMGVRHIHSPGAITKYSLVKLINDTYDLGCTITPVESGRFCDRTLSSWYPMGFDIPTIEEQIIEQKNYLRR